MANLDAHAGFLYSRSEEWTETDFTFDQRDKEYSEESKMWRLSKKQKKEDCFFYQRQKIS